MVNSMFYGNQAIYQRWIDRRRKRSTGSSDLFSLPDEDFKLTFAAGSFPDFYEPRYYIAEPFLEHVDQYSDGSGRNRRAANKQGQGGRRRSADGTPACQLIKEDGKVVSVIAKTAEGYVKYLCAKGVVLATGGYEFNPTKLKECCRPRDLALNHWMNGTASNTGDGHEMGKAISAIEDEYPHPLMLDPAQLMPYLRVNKLGKRFTPEYEPYNHLALAMQNQPGAINWYYHRRRCRGRDRQDVDTVFFLLWAEGSLGRRGDERKRVESRYTGRTGGLDGRARRRVCRNDQSLECHVRSR